MTIFPFELIIHKYWNSIDWITDGSKNNLNDNYLKIQYTRFEDFLADIQFIQIPFELFGSLALPDERKKQNLQETRTSFSPKLGQRNSISITAFQRIILPRTNFEGTVTTFVYVSIYSTQQLEIFVR